VLLRDFQSTLIDQIVDSAKQHLNIAVICPTGSGKTVIASALIEYFCRVPIRKVLFLVDNRTLIEQTGQKLKAKNIKYGVIAAGYTEPNYGDYSVFIASLQTIEKRPEWLNKFWHLLLFDEVHETGWRKESLKLIERSTKWVIGFTATPYRLSNKEYFADIFQDAIISPSFAELQSKGYLAPIDYYGVDHADFSAVKIARGDYLSGAIAEIVNTEKTILKALDAYKKYGDGKRAIAFAVNVAHAKAIANIANREGITSAVITGETKQRDKIFIACDDGTIQLLVSCMALTKGFDLPSVKVALLMRPSKSHAIIEQQCGRVARPYLNQTAIIIDCVGNLESVGYPCERVHTRESVLSRKPLKEAGEAPVKTCPDCARIVAAYHKNCPFCGYYFIQKAKEVTDFTGEIGKLILSRDVKNINTEEAHKQYYRQLIRKNYKSKACASGAYREYCERKFELYPKPIIAWALGALFDGNRDHFDKYCRNVQNFANRWVKESQRSWFIRAQIINEFGNYTNKIQTNAPN